MIIKEKSLNYDDVLLIPKRSTLSSRKDVKLTRLFKFKNNIPSFECVPIIAANMLTGNFKMADSFAQNNMMVAIAKHNNAIWNNYVTYETAQKYIKNCWYTIGMCDDELQILKRYFDIITSNIGLQEARQLKICIDIANGYSQKFADYIAKARDLFPNNVIMAGNVCTPEMTQELILKGASVAKIGIGPGSHCSTRIKTGVGVSQFSSVVNCSDVAHGLGAYVCADGGIKTPGDFAKAFGANADFVMAGSMFAGSDESDGEVITKYEHDGTYNKVIVPLKSYNPRHKGYKSSLISEEYYHYDPNIVEKKYKVFYGMSSDSAPGNKDKNKDYRTSEGIEGVVPYTGPVQTTINDILGGLRSACTYIGATEIKYMGKCASFTIVNNIK